MRFRILPVAAFIVWPTLSLSAQSRPVTLELLGGVGSTSATDTAWVGAPVTDWKAASYRVGALALAPVSPKISVGGEIAWQHLVQYRLVSSGSIRNDDALLVGALGRLALKPRLALDLGVAMYRFGGQGFTLWGGSLALGYAIPVGERVAIPIRARVDYVNDRLRQAVPLQILTGLSVRLR